MTDRQSQADISTAGACDTTAIDGIMPEYQRPEFVTLAVSRRYIDPTVCGVI